MRTLFCRAHVHSRARRPAPRSPSSLTSIANERTLKPALFRYESHSDWSATISSSLFFALLLSLSLPGAGNASRSTDTPWIGSIPTVDTLGLAAAGAAGAAASGGRAEGSAAHAGPAASVIASAHAMA